MVKERRRYTREFKLEAVKLALESERPLAEVARGRAQHCGQHESAGRLLG